MRSPSFMRVDAFIYVSNRTFVQRIIRSVYLKHFLGAHGKFVDGVRHIVISIFTLLVGVRFHN